jgi:hypothetical protein
MVCNVTFERETLSQHNIIVKILNFSSIDDRNGLKSRLRNWVHMAMTMVSEDSQIQGRISCDFLWGYQVHNIDDIH